MKSDRVAVGELPKGELIIGIVIGASLGLISFFLVYVSLGDTALSMAVGLAVLAAGTVSTIVGFGLP